MDPVTVKVTLPDIVAEMLEDQRPRSLPTATFCAFLIEQGLDASLPTRMITGKGGRGVGASEPQASNSQQPQTQETESSYLPSSNEEERKELKRRAPKQVSDAPRKRFIFSVPDDLCDYKADLLAYWREDKGGKKSEAAARTLIKGCRDIRDRYGDKVLKDQIELARGYGWENITLRNYEAHGLPKGKGGAPAQAEFKHPASRDFTAERLERERRLAEGDQSIPSATGGRGVLDLF
jgi:hypothetical protein